MLWQECCDGGMGGEKDSGEGRREYKAREKKYGGEICREGEIDLMWYKSQKERERERDKRERDRERERREEREIEREREKRER